jgi:hypothetical protein
MAQQAPIMHQNPHLKYTTAICEGTVIHSSKCAAKKPFFCWMCNEMKTTLLSSLFLTDRANNKPDSFCIESGADWLRG